MNKFNKKKPQNIIMLIKSHKFLVMNSIIKSNHEFNKSHKIML